MYSLRCLSGFPCLPRFLIIPRRQYHGELVRRLIRPLLFNHLHQFLVENIVACWVEVEAYTSVSMRLKTRIPCRCRTIVHEFHQGVVLRDVQRPRQLITELPSVCLEVRLRHEGFPKIHDGKVELSAKLDNCIGICFGCTCQARDASISIGLVSWPPKMLVDWGRSNQDDTRPVSFDLRMKDNVFQVLDELIERNVLFVRRVWQG